MSLFAVKLGLNAIRKDTIEQYLIGSDQHQCIDELKQEALHVLIILILCQIGRFWSVVQEFNCFLIAVSIMLISSKQSQMGLTDPSETA